MAKNSLHICIALYICNFRVVCIFFILFPSGQETSVANIYAGWFFFWGWNLWSIQNWPPSSGFPSLALNTTNEKYNLLILNSDRSSLVEAVGHWYNELGCLLGVGCEGLAGTGQVRADETTCLPAIVIQKKTMFYQIVPFQYGIFIIIQGSFACSLGPRLSPIRSK